MADRTTPITVGEAAPDFRLVDQDANHFKLSDQKGKKVLLSFHPFAFTGVCMDQMRSLEVNSEKIMALNTVPVGISIDPQPSKKAWAAVMGLKSLKILSDFWPHGAAIKTYGLFREHGGHSERANVIVDENGKVAWVKVYQTDTLPDINEVIDTLKKLK